MYKGLHGEEVYSVNIPIVTNAAPLLMVDKTFYSPGVQCSGGTCTSIVTGQLVENPIADGLIKMGSGIAAGALIHPIAGVLVGLGWLLGPTLATKMKSKPVTQGG